MRRLYNLTIAVLLVLLVACATKRTTTAEPLTLRDSSQTLARYEVIERIDTQYITLPPQYIERTVRDTASTLATDFATSYARITPDGLLHHRLENKQQLLATPTKVITIKQDSIVYREREVPVFRTVTIEKKPLWWQRGQQAVLGILLVVVGVMALFWRKNRW